MKTRGLIIPFHRFTPFYQDNYRIIFEMWKQHFQYWKDEITTLYFIDSNDFLYQGELDAFTPFITVLKTNNFSHAENLNYAITQVKEDLVGIMDMDTLIGDHCDIEVAFAKIDEELGGEFDVAAMIEKPSPGKISRFAPYYFFARMSALKKVEPINFDPDPPEHLDPLAKLTHQLLPTGIKYCELMDDRSTIQLTKDGEILRRVDEGHESCTHYHVRNFNGGIHLVDSWSVNRENAKHHISLMPAEEITRIFGWLWTLNVLTIQKERIYNDIIEILNFKEVAVSAFPQFLREFNEFHKNVL